MKKLSSTLSTILSVLDDAELQQHQQRAIQDWLCKLKDAAYEARDILQDCAAEASRGEYKGSNHGYLRKVWTCYPVQNLLFQHNIGTRMKSILEDLDSIAQERIKFHLNERTPENLIQFNERRETSSALPQVEVFGREVDKDCIVNVLMVDLCHIKEVSVYPIIGMGRLGKTTLAQLVSSDERIKSHFEQIIWVYVSPDFSVKRVMKLIIEYVSKKMFEESSLDSLQRKVREVLTGKRYLLVLDDVWNEDQEEWDKLKCALSSGSSGSCILVTTRSEKVTSIARTRPTYPLSVLSEDDCWLLFRQRAFGPDSEESPDLVAIGKEIVKKCGGVPLAAKALGGLMRSKMGVKEWVNIKDSNLWDLPQGEVPILPALRLSYYNLPLEMRHCFSYCAVFPQGSRMKKDKLIQLWMANGFIASRGRFEVEDVGNEIWNELYKRSLFLKDDKDPENMFMHDLVHDLARSIIDDELCTMEAKISSTMSKQKIRHAALVSSFMRLSAFPEALRGQNKLHSILLQYRGQYNGDSESEFSCDFKNFGSLRVFDANGAKMMQLSGSIGNSKHLTYVNLSETEITNLPKSICCLHQLQTLNLNYCRKLERLPKKMHCLTSMRHLHLRRCLKIEEMPPKLGKITLLKTLGLFVVGESRGQRLSELQHLNLGGELHLRNLERVQNATEAREANLDGKLNLSRLVLEWDKEIPGNTVENEVIEALQPHPNIKELTITGYRGKEMPVWMSDPSVLRNVVNICIIQCRNCLGLPALWNLPCLKFLEVSGMREMEYMFENGNNNNNNLSGGSIVTSSSSPRAFSSLEILDIGDIPNLKGLLSTEKDEEEEGKVQQQLPFPCLRKMVIARCPKFALPMLPVLEELDIIGRSLTSIASISKLTSLTSLALYYNDDMVSFPEEMLQNLTLLQSLYILNYEALNVLPENMSSLSSLLDLTIVECPKIESLPDSIRTLTQLQTLNNWSCSPEFSMRYEKGKGPEWYKIAHIPQVWILVKLNR